MRRRVLIVSAADPGPRRVEVSMNTPSPVELYDRLLGLDPRHERRGKTLPYTSRNGHMYSFVSADGEVCVRLPEVGRREFREHHGGGEVVQHGRVMKEYVSVPPALLLEHRDEVLSVLDESLEYVLSLRPKSTPRA
jgi:hypothetical protein